MYGAIAVLLGVYLWARTKSSADETAIDAIADPEVKEKIQALFTRLEAAERAVANL